MTAAITVGTAVALIVAVYLSIPWLERLFRWLFQTRFVSWLTKIGERLGGKGG